jgi:hypothetical protein
MREGQLARAFVELSDTLVRDYDVMEFLSRLCQRSVEVLEVTAAGALLTDGARRLQVVAASTETVDGPGDAANPGPGGPCVDAYRSGRQVAAPDLRRTARRWPVFTPVIGRDLYDGYRGRLKPEPTTGTDQIPVSQPRPLEPGEQQPATSPPPPTADPIGPPTRQ